MPKTLQIVGALAALAVPTCLLASRAYRSYLFRTYTATRDLLSLGKPRAGGKLSATAVICGGSLAGLMTARVCSDHFERVIVVEPEAWALSDAAREGPLTTGTRTVETERGVSYTTATHKRTRVYQYLGYHVYQAFLTLFLRALFPTFDKTVEERRLLIAPCDYNLHIVGRRMLYPYKEYETRGETLPPALFTTRRSLEALLRTLVKAACPHIEYIHGTATDLKLSTDGRRVTAVSVRTDSATVQDLQCDMVVDCTGNTQAGLKLLARAIPTASDELQKLRVSYDPKMYYSGIEYPLPQNFEEELAQIEIPSDNKAGRMDTGRHKHYFTWGTNPSKDHRTLFITRWEGGVYVGAGGWNSETPLNLQEMREYARAIKGDRPVPEYVFKILDLLEPVANEGEVFEAKINSCSRIFYERAHAILPNNFIAHGDSVMRLNPRFGEGITKSSVGATTLDGTLRSFSPFNANFGRTFLRRLADRSEGLWDAAKLTDYGAETTIPAKGETRNDGAFARWYGSVLNRLVAKDAEVASTFYHVGMFLAPSALLSTPTVLGKVLLEALFPTPA
ncbi:hypothetical protein EXIGLDRAFT_724163 [Exidia glandulosa HHB12029]|uniref:FAD/NAD(P)-binding domain-containing protein n=1 Tax=Exidia glandulosa HHB12029 TaxID=1314781 RepID=A0A165EIK8_EXIGL|nr:hypothetical protein EXIGLDRAFT_724163 [Exidia glandulosa HHB12029]